jgi:hypothetical protein
MERREGGMSLVASKKRETETHERSEERNNMIKRGVG